MITPHHQFTNVWEVIQIYAHRVLMALSYLDRIKANIKAHSHVDSAKAFQENGLQDNLDHAFEFLTPALKPLDLKLAEIKIEEIQFMLPELIKTVPAKQVGGQVIQALEELDARITDELRSRLLYYFNSKEKEFIEQGVKLFGDKVLGKFPESIYDLDEAAKCLGFSRYTACVFHLVRPMESAVRVIGEQLNVTVKDKIKGDYLFWGILMENIKVRMESLKELDKNEYEKWTPVIGMLNCVRVAWRNTTMHPGPKYTDEEAKEVFEAVRIFLKHLAKKLS